jgi:hypothetical protein
MGTALVAIIGLWFFQESIAITFREEGTPVGTVPRASIPGFRVSTVRQVARSYALRTAIRSASKLCAGSPRQCHGRDFFWRLPHRNSPYSLGYLVFRLPSRMPSPALRGPLVMSRSIISKSTAYPARLFETSNLLQRPSSPGPASWATIRPDTALLRLAPQEAACRVPQLALLARRSEPGRGFSTARTLLEVTASVTDNFDNHDNLYGYSPRFGRIVGHSHQRDVSILLAWSGYGGYRGYR